MLVMAALLFPCLLWAVNRHTAEPERDLVIYFKGASAFPAHVVWQIQSEVEHAMRPLNLRLEWRAMEGNYRTDPGCMVLILTFTGTCLYEPNCPRRIEPVALGWTHITDGEILPFCTVDCSLVRQTIAFLVQSRPGPDRQALISRAIGRVIAHEFYHILAETKLHSKQGLARSLLGPEDLTLYEARFDALAIGRMRSELQKRTCTPPQSYADGR